METEYKLYSAEPTGFELVIISDTERTTYYLDTMKEVEQILARFNIKT